MVTTTGTHAATAVLLLIAAVAADWITEPRCLRVGGTIKIDSEVVPDVAQICSWCDQSSSHPVILHWDKKYLIIYVDSYSSSKTFNVREIQYYEGTWSWYSELTGVRGNINGAVTCSHPIASDMLCMGTNNPPDDHSCPATASKVMAKAHKASAPVRAEECNPSKRAINLTDFYVQYSTANDTSIVPEITSGCFATEASDLPLILGVSGGVTACVLLAAAFAAAPRLLCST
ncbi:uncharacterized protein LOC117650925 [Thrips palmi]|uniref:Uncharacterized protein LOC117650925 n=1 Tax=Thrips palmi TaxID=161013 RepID=A0A6P8ZZF0_THRPL|nr:uncharacterized protein LOC117650925 [Thrips palmi]